jgi:hypothetical protein
MHGKRNSKNTQGAHRGQRLLCERNEVRFRFIKQQSHLFPITLLCPSNECQ